MLLSLNPDLSPSHRQTPPSVGGGWGGGGGGWCRCFQSSFPPGCSTVTIRLVSSCSDGRPSGAPFHPHRWFLGHTAPSWVRQPALRGSGCPKHLVQSVSGVSTAILAVSSPSWFWFPSNVDLISTRVRLSKSPSNPKWKKASLRRSVSMYLSRKPQAKSKCGKSQRV